MKTGLPLGVESPHPGSNAKERNPRGEKKATDYEESSASGRGESSSEKALKKKSKA